MSNTIDSNIAAFSGYDGYITPADDSKDDQKLDKSLFKGPSHG